MLSKGDRNWIKKTIQEEFKEALLWKITVDKGIRKPGDVERHYETEDVNVLAFLAKYLPFVEGALRGMQEDADKTNNKILDLPIKLESIASILMDSESTLIKLASFVKMLEDNQILLSSPQQKLIDIDESST